MTKQRGRFSYAFMAIIITLSMFIGGTTNSIYAAEGDIPATNEYLSDTNTIALDFNDTSTNGHTKFVKIWVQNNSVFVAVRSTHELANITLEGISPLAMKQHEILEHIKINDSEFLNPMATLKGNVGDSRWTIATFPMSVVSTTGTYNVFVK